MVEAEQAVALMPIDKDAYAAPYLQLQFVVGTA